MSPEVTLPFTAPLRAWWWPRLPRARVATCMLHSVGDRLDLPDCPPNNAIEPPKLEAVIRLLRRAGYAFVKFSDAFGRGGSEAVAGSRRVCLTFDDGFADNRTNLLPILQRTGAVATCFVTNRGADDARYLSPAQLRELDASGLVEIGGHTANHCLLGHADEATARREIAENKRWIEDALGHRVTAFAYPRGEYDDTAVGIVRACGYTCAATMEKGRREPPQDAWHVHRQILPRGKTPTDLYLLATRGKYRL